MKYLSLVSALTCFSLDRGGFDEVVGRLDLEEEGVDSSFPHYLLHTAYVSIRQHTSAYVSIHHTSSFALYLLHINEARENLPLQRLIPLMHTVPQGCDG
jgi:hypothetical protein